MNNMLVGEKTFTMLATADAADYESQAGAGGWWTGKGCFAVFHGTKFSPVKNQKSAILFVMLKFERLGWRINLTHEGHHTVTHRAIFTSLILGTTNVGQERVSLFYDSSINLGVHRVKIPALSPSTPHDETPTMRLLWPKRILPWGWGHVGNMGIPWFRSNFLNFR